jgi:hypothetical protein
MYEEYPIPENGMSLDAIQKKLDIAARALGSASHGFDEDDLGCKQLVLLEKYLYEVIEKIEERQDLETLYGES